MNLDDEIVRYLSQGDERGIELIISYYGGLLKSVVSKHLYSLQEYQGECVNDTLLAVWNNWESYDPKRSSFKNWICAIARYRAINYLKKHARELEEVQFDEIAPYLTSRQEIPLQAVRSRSVKILRTCLQDKSQHRFWRHCLLYPMEQPRTARRRQPSDGIPL